MFAKRFFKLIFLLLISGIFLAGCTDDKKSALPEPKKQEVTKTVEAKQQETTSQNTQNDSKKEIPSEPTENKETSSKPMDYKEWLKWSIEKEIGAKNNLGSAKVGVIEFEGGNETRPVIGIIPNDNITLNLVRVGMLQDAAMAFRVIFADPRASTVTIGMFRPMMDSYGNNKIKNVMVIQMSRKTAEKINWQNFISKNLPEVADSFYEMPGWK